MGGGGGVVKCWRWWMQWVDVLFARFRARFPVPSYPRSPALHSPYAVSASVPARSHSHLHFHYNHHHHHDHHHHQRHHPCLRQRLRHQLHLRQHPRPYPHWLPRRRYWFEPTRRCRTMNGRGWHPTKTPLWPRGQRRTSAHRDRAWVGVCGLEFEVSHARTLPYYYYSNTATDLDACVRARVAVNTVL